MVAGYRYDSNKSLVFFTGGFGNQMFQLSFGLYLQNKFNQSVVFNGLVGNPREWDDEIAICKFSFPSNLDLRRDFSVFRFLYSKAFGWQISHAFKTAQEKKYRQLINILLTKSLLKSKFGLRKPIKASKDLGFDESLDASIDNNPAIYVGYFQTFIYPIQEKVFENLFQMRLRHESDLHRETVRTIAKNNPIMLHIRLGDYLLEEEFGVPSLRYYQSALEQLREKSIARAVWIFSDDIELAEKYLGKLTKDYPMKFFNQNDFTDAEIWDLMRNFSAYVLSNSTFVWWAAFLRRNQEAPVYAPKPWFRSINDPSNLLPPNWIKLDST